jgi:hypothetical protein
MKSFSVAAAIAALATFAAANPAPIGAPTERDLPLVQSVRNFLYPFS